MPISKSIKNHKTKQSSKDTSSVKRVPVGTHPEPRHKLQPPFIYYRPKK